MPRRKRKGDAQRGKMLRETRKSAGLTQAEVAARIGCDIKTMRRYEQGETSPTEEWMERWRYAVGVHIPQVHDDTLWSPDDEVQFVKVLKSAAEKPLKFGGVNLCTKFFPESLWKVENRAEHLFKDDPEDRQRVYVEWTKSALPDDMLKRLMNELAHQKQLYEVGQLALTESEANDLVEVYNRLTQEFSNPYPRPVALPELVTINQRRVLPIYLGQGKYGIALIAEKNLDLPTASEFRSRFVLHSLALRCAYVFERPDGTRWVECHQREARGNATWKHAWDTGAAGYIDPLRHKDPENRLRISPWQGCCDELTKELNIDRFELPHRDNYYFFGFARDNPTGVVILLAYAHAQYEPPKTREIAPLVTAYDRCQLTPEAVADFIAEKQRWVPSAILTFILTLEAFNYSKEEIEEAFAKRLPGNIDLSS